MTTSRYRSTGRATGSQVCGDTSSPAANSPADYAWIVNFNNGNSDWNNRDNKNYVRAVRSVPASECQGVTFRALHSAWRRARRNKIPSENQLEFEAKLIDNLFDLCDQLASGTWKPRPTSCFVAKRPKAREIHAPDFGDRVVHHWLVPQLERLYDARFIDQSFANRKGKGTHAAVAQLRSYVRQVDSGQGGGWFLQLDIRNFFNSIHRPTLYRMLKKTMLRSGLHIDAQRAAHALIATSPLCAGVRHRSSTEERALVPLHKRLENAAKGCGLPIGNLSSQFLANVYLDALDQFVKRTLKAKRYVRYVDDFVIVHSDRAQLEAWQLQIVEFLRKELRLELKDDIRLRSLRDGIDFLGYVVYPTHTRVRRRVVRHAFAALSALSRPRSPEQFQQRRSVLASYLGHFKHANASKLSALLESKQ